ncbi:MAG: ribonuclease HII [Paludibacteraceae bacterium]|nr:ribonuclease HII [Paludibacteraceae bacterium]
MLKPYMMSGIVEAGCDEAGRGPLAGSVFAAAVILPPDFTDEVLNDSKQLTERQRYALREVIEREAVAWAVAEVTAEEIDRINILQASITGMHRALAALKDKQGNPIVPEHILVDGNKWKPYVPEGGLLEVPARTVVKGDATYMSIAAASVLAKTYRDDYMLRLHEQYPMYGWDENKGYPTAAHYEAIQKYGVTPYHRKSFNLKLKMQN